jgi:hypothetical protein
MNTLDLLPKNVEKTVFIDSEEAIDVFLSKDIEYFLLNVFDLFKVQLCTESDIMFLIDGYNDLGEKSNFVKHYCFLGDGELIIETVLNNVNNVNINIQLCPFLDRKNIKYFKHNLTIDDYFLAWQNLIFQISKILY